ncbi:integrase [Candidatus Desulfofervidus auxilii]|uniref:Integrase n=1 Tax=Desulfofervidus auxilii TaxID=1621989 RepID=A0A7U4QKU2_DESA2|nr:transposase [Candidatus Desulfofervidus auxilii]AMM41166.1 integrase [Candidatus Desulfofervidus auxilii]CAD7777004.1 Transposase [Candidatus Methanoperedenaceae archaeon GB50]
MKKRYLSEEEKMAIVLAGLKGEQSVAEICREHQISQSQYYKWRDRFLEAGKNALAYGVPSKKEAMLKAEIKRLQRIIGKQTVQIEVLKKTEELFGIR